MAYKQYKMKGHTLPGIKQSPAKQISKPMGGPGDARKDDSPAKQPWGDYYDTRSAKKKSPAKCPLLAMAPAIIGAIGAMKKNKEQ
jgi:hypothetical protein